MIKHVLGANCLFLNTAYYILLKIKTPDGLLQEILIFFNENNYNIIQHIGCRKLYFYLQIVSHYCDHCTIRVLKRSIIHSINHLMDELMNE